MTKVADPILLFPRIVHDAREIERLRWFQTERYVESGLLATMPCELPADPHVHCSTYFGVYTKDNRIQATARIVSDDLGLPMMQYHEFYPWAQERIDGAKGRISELSRLAVANDAPRRLTLSLLGREFVRFSIANPRAAYLVGSVGDPLARILKRILQIEPEVLGPTIPQYGDFVEDTSPILLDGIKCVAALRERNDDRSRFFFQDLVIDLTQSDELAPAAKTMPLAVAGG